MDKKTFLSLINIKFNKNKLQIFEKKRSLILNIFLLILEIYFTLFKITFINNSKFFNLFLKKTLNLIKIKNLCYFNFVIYISINKK